jgi:biotin operon repressor
VGEIEQKLRLSQPSVSKHLRVLREAGFVESRVEAQRRLYRLRPEPLMELDEWLAPFRRFWSKHVDALERHLDAMGAAGWHICLDVMERALGGHPIGRIVGADAMKFSGWQRLHAEYATRFGVDSARVMRG